MERKDNCTARAFALLQGTLILVLTGTVPSPGNVLKGLEASPQKYLHVHTDCCNVPQTEETNQPSALVTVSG